jgi:transposase, IS30 family
MTLILISERPAEAADRASPHSLTEGDLILGSNCRSAIATLVERQSRYVMLVPLPDGHTATEVRDGLLKVIATLPRHLRMSLTWDQGTELSEHAQITLARLRGSNGVRVLPSRVNRERSSSASTDIVSAGS